MRGVEKEERKGECVRIGYEVECEDIERERERKEKEKKEREREREMRKTNCCGLKTTL